MARGVTFIIPRSIRATAYGVFRLLQRFEGFLASTSTGQGASLVGVEDAAGNFSATDVEAALAELVSGAGSGAIADTNAYYTTDTVDGAFDALGLQIGGDTDATYTFSNQYVVANDGPVYSNLNLIDIALGNLLPNAKYTFWDDFDYQVLDTTNGPWAFYEGTDAATITGAILPDEARGVVRLVTGDDAAGTYAANGAEIVAAGAPARADLGGLIIEFYVRIDDVSTMSLQIGLTDNKAALEEAFQIDGADVVTATADDSVCFVYDTAALTDEWFACAVDTTVVDAGVAATGVAPVNDTWARYTITVSADGATIRFSIDGTTVATLTGDTGVAPGAILYPYVTASSKVAASRRIDVDYTVMRLTR